MILSLCRTTATIGQVPTCIVQKIRLSGDSNPGSRDPQGENTLRCNMAANIANDWNKFFGPENVCIDTKIVDLFCLDEDI